MREREGCRVLLVNATKLPPLEAFLVREAIPHTRLADVRGYAAIAQATPDCTAYAAL
jgi:hypothetical protein